MIVCKITLDKQTNFDYTSIREKILNVGDFIFMNVEDKYEILFASEKDEVEEEYIRKVLRKNKIDYMMHVYSAKDKFDYDSYQDQWVLENLDKQYRIKVEREQQPKLKEIDRKLDLLNKVTDEFIKAKERYNEEAQKIIVKEKQDDLKDQKQ